MVDFNQGEFMRRILFTIGILLCSPWACAHGPTPQKAKETITVHASPEKVWSLLKQFDAIAGWHPALKSSDGDGRNQAGGSRRLTFRNGEILVEELDYFNEWEHEYSYRLRTENTAALPVSSYVMDIKVAPGQTPDSCQVTWKGRYYRGDTGNNPPASLDDAAAVQAVTGFVHAGLEGLKAKFD